MNKEVTIIGKITDHNCAYSTEEINKQIEELKSKLKYTKFIEKGEIVGIYLDRNIQMITSMCALFNLQIPFLFLDKEQPMKRREVMLAKCGVNTIITLKKYVSVFKGKSIICLDNTEEEWKEILEQTEKQFKSQTAYIIFTSGSTGEPKGVEITRSGFACFLSEMSKQISLNKDTRIGCFASCSFDIFFVETILALMAGVTVVIGDEKVVKNTRKLIKFIKDKKINMLQFTPSRLKMIQMLDNQFKCFENVKTLLVGGEQFPESLLHTLQKNTSATIYNVYGPTETTVWTTISNLTNANTVDIGNSFDYNKIYILDSNFQKCTNGELGEICIAGKGLALGYINNPKQTENAFVNVEIDNENVRIYRTGDLGFVREDGHIICQGRIDNQIKYNGHRIELEEIESCLMKMKEIRNVAVCFDVEHNCIIAFILPGANAKKEIIHQAMKEVVPDYMCPADYIFVKKLIYTTSGKIDRVSLLKNYWGKCKKENNTSYREKSLDDERWNDFIKILAENLNISPSGIKHTSKMENLGLDSISFVTIVVELEDYFNFEFEDDKMEIAKFENINDLYLYVQTMCQI